MSLAILYADRHLVVVNKPARLLTAGSSAASLLDEVREFERE